MAECERRWAVWALFLGCGEPRTAVALGSAALRHAHHAVMRAVAAATRRQVGLALWRERKERRCKGQAENGQQRDGDELKQSTY